MLGSVIHYTVTVPEVDHARCQAQADGIRRYHMNNGYRDLAYNGLACQHGGKYWYYFGPNQASGNTWANLNLTAISAMIDPDHPPTDALLTALYEMTTECENGRNEIHPHSDYYQTSCCGDPLREWIARGALPANIPPTPKRRFNNMTVGYLPWFDNKILTYLIGGNNTIIHEFKGPGNPVYGVPQDALDFAAGTNCGTFQLTGDEWVKLLRNSGVAV